MNLDVRAADVVQPAQAELDDLSVDGRPGVTDRLDVPLPELAVATRLRAVVAEHLAETGEAHRLRPRLHAMFDVGTNDAGRRLRSEREAGLVVARRNDAEQLLLHHVGRLAYATLVDTGLLDERRLDWAVAIAGSELVG